MKTLCLGVLIFLLSSGSVAQELTVLSSNDTSSMKSLFFPSSRNSIGDPSLLQLPVFPDTAMIRSFPKSSLGYELLADSPGPEHQGEFSWQMTLSPKSKDPLEMLRMMLGAVEAGGASYMAYRHIKKYGFLK